MRIEKKIISFECDKNKKILPPKYKVGERFQINLSNADNSQKHSTIGTIISNNTIDFLTFGAIYDVETEEIDFIGRKIIFESVPEHFFKGLKKVK